MIILNTLILASCAPTTFYQVYKAIPSEKLEFKQNEFVYEDENCIVSYNLWDNGGDIGFQFYNKTDVTIYLNLEESFFILNGVSYNYYRNRIFTNSSSSGTTTSRGGAINKSVTGLNQFDQLQTNRVSNLNSIGFVSSNSISVSFNEEKVVRIPPKTTKTISEYKINTLLFRDCDLYKYPTKKQIIPKTFTKEQSPIVFSNRITYNVGSKGEPTSFENEFHVSEISNYPENELVSSKIEEFCGQKSVTPIRYFKDNSADKFYIRYSKGTDIFRH